MNTAAYELMPLELQFCGNSDNSAACEPLAFSGIVVNVAMVVVAAANLLFNVGAGVSYVTFWVQTAD